MVAVAVVQFVEGLFKRLCELANERRRLGYLRSFNFVVREGFGVHHKKLMTFYREKGLAVYRRRSRRRALGMRRPILVPDRANQRWSPNFVSHAIADVQRFKVLCIVDKRRRDAQAILLDRSLSGARLIRALDGLIRSRGYPDTIVSNNGTTKGAGPLP